MTCRYVGIVPNLGSSYIFDILNVLVRCCSRVN